MRLFTWLFIMDSIDKHIINRIKKASRGTAFFVDDFLRFGNANAVRKALERLVQKGKLDRIARGIYALLKEHPTFGKEIPATEAIAKAIARRDKAKIIPTGAMALNALGLSSQVPVNVVYLTDGSARTINIGNRKIKFKKTSPKNLAAIGKISTLVIQALKEIGKDKATQAELKKILKHLEAEEPYRLEHDIKLAPEWIRVIMRKALKKEANGQMV